MKKPVHMHNHPLEKKVTNNEISRVLTRLKKTQTTLQKFATVATHV